MIKTMVSTKESHEGIRHSREQNLLLAEDLNPLFNGLLGLLASRALGATEDKLSNKTPVGGQVPLLSNGSVEKRVVMLQVSAEADGLQSSPD